MQKTKRLLNLVGAFALLVGVVVQAIPPSTVSAAQIPSPRRVTLMTGTLTSDVNGDTIPDGGSIPGATANHLFEFTLPTGTAGGSDDGNASNNVGSITFQYCTTAAPVPNGVDCIAPTGVDLTNAGLGSESGVTGFTGMLKTTQDDANDGVKNTVTLQRTTATDIPTASNVSYRLDNVVNPTTTNETFFIRISTYSSLDGTGTSIDSGTVAASTTTAIMLNGTMPESLVFCTGRTIGVTVALVPDCSQASDGAVSFDRLFSPQDTAQATSQMAASTNAGLGYAITVNGPTLTSGSNTIGGVATTDYSKQGTPQFGLNLVENIDFCGSGCNLGTNITQTGGTLYNGEARTGYSTGGANCTAVGCAQFTFVNGATVADSLLGNGTPATGASDAQIYTVSYVVNVPGSQPAGTYTTTLTYICTPTF